ncbi:MAG TPA: hypothetical protein PKN48_12030 [Bacteroidales bacterium]|nr:hypothetical protein [Bacteroidales bacterium]
MSKGWKPLPVILKIVFVILISRVFFSVFSISPSFDNGFDIFGFTLYGLYAVNIFFILKTLLPLVILVCMYQRYRHTWIIAVVYFFFMSVSLMFTLTNSTEMLQRILEQMPDMFELPTGMDENEFQKLLLISLKVSVVFSALFELAIAVLFLVKRKYFSRFTLEENFPPEEKSSS